MYLRMDSDVQFINYLEDISHFLVANYSIQSNLERYTIFYQSRSQYRPLS